MDALFSVDWRGLFVPTSSITELLIRGTSMYFVLFLLMRFFLKRQAGVIGVADLIVVVIIADAAQNALSGDYGSITEGIILVSTIAFWNFAIDWLDYKIPALRGVIAGRPLMLVRRGRVLPSALRRERLTEDELASQIRLHGLQRTEEVEAAYIEPNGHVSVIKREASDTDDPDESGAGVR